jgi:hypothetical protein
MNSDRNKIYVSYLKTGPQQQSPSGSQGPSSVQQGGTHFSPPTHIQGT